MKTEHWMALGIGAVVLYALGKHTAQTPSGLAADVVNNAGPGFTGYLGVPIQWSSQQPNGQTWTDRPPALYQGPATTNVPAEYLPPPGILPLFTRGNFSGVPGTIPDHLQNTMQPASLATPITLSPGQGEVSQETAIPIPGMGGPPIFSSYDDRVGRYLPDITQPPLTTGQWGVIVTDPSSLVVGVGMPPRVLS